MKSDDNVYRFLDTLAISRKSRYDYVCHLRTFQAFVAKRKAKGKVLSITTVRTFDSPWPSLGQGHHQNDRDRRKPTQNVCLQRRGTGQERRGLRQGESGTEQNRCDREETSEVGLCRSAIVTAPTGCL